jgi:exodeoxyribonuclease V alpha subunit
MSILSPSDRIEILLANQELFSPLDRHFSRFIARLARCHKPETALAAALVSRTTNEGNICLDLPNYASNPIQQGVQANGEEPYVCPSLGDWLKKLEQSGTVGTDTDNTPLVLGKNDKLYLRRYRQYENTVAGFIKDRSEPVEENFDLSNLSRDLGRLFTPLPAGETDWQQIAAVVAATRSFCVISGGPGTGKTYTVARILALLHGQFTDRPPRILLGAPTGKAASRLQQAIAETSQAGQAEESLKATTLHRLLGALPSTPYFRHNADNPLDADIVVVDEASMVDLPLMAKLMAALPSRARLILLGDRHQLASVQPGSVLGDICSSTVMAGFTPQFSRLIKKHTAISWAMPGKRMPTAISSPLQDSFVELMHSHRFAPGSSIGALSSAVRNGDGKAALAVLEDPGDDSTAWSDIPADSALAARLAHWSGISRLKAMEMPQTPASCFAYLDAFRILCGLRRGPFGAAGINSLLEHQLAIPHPDNPPVPTDRSIHQAHPLLPFQPVMITRNDYSLRLFNGDIGVIVPDPENPQVLKAYFRNETGELRSFTPGVLPEHQTVFAMTVHKSQGSEFDRVLLILPDRDSELLSRELLYTAITRARQQVEIWGSREIFVRAVKRRIKRTSGLAETLWGD